MKNYQFITIIVLILLWIGSTHYIISKIPEKVTANMLAIEYNKVGWMQNYEKLTKIQREQIIAWLKQYEAQNWTIKPSNVVKTQNAVKENIAKWNTISQDTISKIEKSSYILWNKDAEISWVEYSDLECPYCKRLHESGSIEKILKQYNWKVNFIYKQFPLRFHPKAQIEAEAALCVWELAGDSKYYDFIQNVYKNSLSNGNSYTKEMLIDLAEKLWIDKNKISSCISSWKYTQEAKRQLQEWSSLFGITWTPWNVFINNKTWEWKKLPWAYPYNSFKSVVDSLLK